MKNQRFLNILFLLSLTFIALDLLPFVEISLGLIKLIPYIVVVIVFGWLLIRNLRFENPNTSIFNYWLPFAAFPLSLLLAPYIIFSSGNSWRTQEILFRNTHIKARTVEFQMQDVGALGYNKRTVEVWHLGKLFTLVYDSPKNIENNSDWVEVNEDVNELGLKYP